MREADHERGWRARAAVALGAVAAMLAVMAFATPARAVASVYEQTGTFGGVLSPPKEGIFPEEVQLAGVSGLAVNTTGAGGVPAGTVYAVGQKEGVRVALYTPNEESGGLDFGLAWEVNPLGLPYSRCGPEVEGEPVCAPHPTASSGTLDVDVDQVTGNVYVLNGQTLKAGSPLITVYSPDGSKVIARFGERTTSEKTTAETPGEIHGSNSGGIAVNDAGEVYVFDSNSADKSYHRLMVFKPEKAGDFEHYIYAGQAHDIGTGFFGESRFPEAPVVDTAGNVYVIGDQDHIQEYDPAKPSKPICDFEFGEGGIIAIAVNPQTGEPFFYSSKDKKVHQLSACEEGKFQETSKVSRTIAANRDNIRALAMDPNRKIGKRPAGALYGATPESSGEPGRGSIGYIFAPAEENPPLVVSEAVAKVTSSTAEVRAQVNPRGFETHYLFQYVAEAAYLEEGESFGATPPEAPLGGALLGSGQSPLVAAAALSGLTPDTGYRYRVVASSHCAPKEPGKVCESAGAPQSFHTFAATIPVPGGPDGRAYELVSPAQKNGGQVLPAEPLLNTCGLVECKPGDPLQHFPMQSSPDGEAVVYEGYPFAPNQGATSENEYIAHHGEAGWSTTNLTPALLKSKGGQGYKAFDAELQEGILEQTSPSLSPEAPTDFTNLYRQPTANPLSLSPLLTEPPPHRLPGGGAERLKLAYVGGSEDLSRLFFEANDELEGQGSGGLAEETNLYEWFAGQLHLVNLGPGEEVLPGALFGSGTLLNGGGGSIPAAVIAHAISADGTRAFFSSKTGQLYVRNGAASTIEIPDHSGKFLAASADGSHVLLSDGHLFTDLQTEPPTEEADLTQGKGGFEGIAGQSEDLSHIYFVDTAVLDPEENSEGAKAQAGKDNLYSWNGTTTHYIATLLAVDNDAGVGDWADAAVQRRAESSPGGRYFAFASQAPLTGVANVGLCKPIASSEEFEDAPCAQVFLYDSATAALSCPSCNPSGARPLGRSFLRVNANVSGSLPQPRYLADSGRLFFDSRDSLVPADSNGGVEDVYEFEPAGVGGCAQAGGCVALLSLGHGSDDSNFLAMDETGDNVFFTTRDRLAPADTDKLIDLYDARVGGQPEEEVLDPGCQGEGCKPPTEGAHPSEPTPTSREYEGSGNVKETVKCRKNQVRRNGRCVAKPHHKRHRRGGGR